MYSFMHYDFFKIWLAESVEIGSIGNFRTWWRVRCASRFNRKHYVDIADRFAKYTSTSFSKRILK